jgi:hypothetical protein
MSSLANWSYTSTATHWKRLSFDSWSRVGVYGAAVAFSCDYEAKAMRMTDANGQEFTSRQVLYTEFPDIEPGDMVLIGTHTGDPVAAKAQEVRSVLRIADTFENLADDFEVVT